MHFNTTSLVGCLHISLDKKEDERGFFARTWCSQESESEGLPDRVVQSSVSFNARKGTLRGLHLQLPPSAEGKFVRCTRGAIVDVVVDLRHSSTSYLQHVKYRLDEHNGDSLYIPPGCAHGFQTLENDTEVFYMMTDFYVPELSSGVRWNDPAFGIDWPIEKPVMNSRDADYPDIDNVFIESLEWI